MIKTKFNFGRFSNYTLQFNIHLNSKYFQTRRYINVIRWNFRISKRKHDNLQTTLKIC